MKADRCFPSVVTVVVVVVVVVVFALAVIVVVAVAVVVVVAATAVAAAAVAVFVECNSVEGETFQKAIDITVVDIMKPRTGSVVRRKNERRFRVAFSRKRRKRGSSRHERSIPISILRRRVRICKGRRHTHESARVEKGRACIRTRTSSRRYIFVDKTALYRYVRGRGGGGRIRSGRLGGHARRKGRFKKLIRYPRLKIYVGESVAQISKSFHRHLSSRAYSENVRSRNLFAGRIPFCSRRKNRLLLRFRTIAIAMVMLVASGRIGSWPLRPCRTGSGGGSIR